MSRVAQELGKILMDFVETFIMAAAIFIVVYMFLLQPHHVQGQSMFPTFHDNDYILTDKITYRFRNPERGDIIVFRAPQNPRSDYIKRIVALPGEKKLKKKKSPSPARFPPHPPPPRGRVRIPHPATIPPEK